jgi:hypothetical protein
MPVAGEDMIRLINGRACSSGVVPKLECKQADEERSGSEYPNRASIFRS